MEDANQWQPTCPPARGLVVPVRVDPTGRTGPTRNQARRGRWRQTTYGFHVPADTDSTCVEQRVLEQSMRLEGQGAVTGWASLRLHLAAFFDGLEPDGRTTIPVPLLTLRQLHDTADSVASRAAIGAPEICVRQGVRSTTVERALTDEIVRRADRREGVVAIDMTCAARLTSLRRMRRYTASLPRRKRRLVLAALALADEHSKSPPESRMRLTWMLDACFPRPVCNRIVYSTAGDVLGCPDLLEVGSGVVGEYDGALHRGRARHRRDVERAELFRAHGLEMFVVVAGDSTSVQVARMAAARARASERADQPRTWTIDPPPGAWIPGEISLDDELDWRDLNAGIELASVE